MIEVMEEQPPFTRTAPTSAGVRCKTYANQKHGAKMPKINGFSEHALCQKYCGCATMKPFGVPACHKRLTPNPLAGHPPAIQQADR